MRGFEKAFKRWELVVGLEGVDGWVDIAPSTFSGLAVPTEETDGVLSSSSEEGVESWEVEELFE